MRRIPFATRTIVIVVFVALGLLGAAGAATSPARPASVVVLISLDGTRPADLSEDRLPALVALSRRGARAERLLPSLPSNTFPNHVTLVTGVAPERHGIVDNRFVDPERGLFTREEIPSWIDVEPLWSLLERRGVVTASFHWVGSEGAWPGGRAPRYWKAFSKQTGEDEKVDQILAWLDLPAKDRPRLITSWFHGADHAGHHQGPDSPRAVRDLQRQDAELARLFDGLRARGLWESTTVIVVSDHGMLVPERRIDLDAALSAAGLEARVIGIGGFASVQLPADQADRAVAVARGLGLSAWRREAAPQALAVDNPRFGPVVVLAPRGAALVHEGLELTGFHGHAPEVPEMAAILVAAGRGIVAGAVLPAVRNVDVAPTVLALLGLEVPDWMEGRPLTEMLVAAGREGS